MNNQNSYLILETKEVFKGCGFGKNCNSYGELVFNTAITGYQEVITDPSYKGQVIVFTYPHIGNVGICSEDNESKKIWAKAIITRELPTLPSNWKSEQSLEQFLKDKHISGIANLDTRELTKIIRDKGNLFGMIVKDNLEYNDALEQLLHYKKTQTISKKYSYGENKIVSSQTSNKNDTQLNISIIDLGCKKSIVDVVKNYQHNIASININNNQVVKQEQDAVIISNGPGYPSDYKEELKYIKEIIDKQVPVLGICLGHQLLALALGCSIENLKFGHHGTNHPVKQLDNDKVFITSQNHNYTVSKKYLPNYLDITHISLFDNTIQGFTHKKQICYGFQGHPEGGPGPVDIQINIFKKFFNEVALKKLNQ